jgi:iron complex transport system ATP-binding protein|tara:strand:+ start:2499 stop:3296 length:798 start_codon:yes stop_codon:yes gene_type:complete
MSLKNLFEAHQVDLYRDQYQVFKNLTLTIKKNESVAIIGANGSGKTTLLKAFNKEIYPASKPNSWLKIYGKENWNAWKLRSMIGYVSDDIYKTYTPEVRGLEIVLSGFHSSIGVHGSIQQKITDDQLRKTKAVMLELNLLNLINKPLFKMSTGQQRRCLLARALVNDPQTLLLDEPTTGLDLISTFQYLKLLTKIKNRGRNIILVTHNLQEINKDIDRVILLRKGIIIADGPQEKIITAKNISLAYGVDIGLSIVEGKYLPYAKG